MKLKVATLLMAFCFGSICAVAQSAPEFDPKYAVILPSSAVPGLLKTCSRDAPGRDKSEKIDAWTPDSMQVAELEKLLPAALSRAMDDHHLDDKSRTFIREKIYDYGRQYGGIVVKGRKLIYLNAVPLSTLQFYISVRGGDLHDLLQREAWQVCDGGAAFFGAEYDPESEKFVAFQFNGQI